MPKDLFSSPMIVDPNTGTYVSQTAYAREVVCSFCGWEGNDTMLLEPSSETCPGCYRQTLHEVENRGSVTLEVDESADNNEIIAKARRIVRHQAGGFLPLGYEHWNVTEAK